MPRPIVSQEAEDLYAALGPWAANDPTVDPGHKVNLVPNGNFEYDTVGAAPAGWTKAPVGLTMTVQATAFSGSSGAHTVRVLGGGPWTFTQTVASPVDEGASYTATIRVGGINDGRSRINILWFNAANALIGTTNSANFGAAPVTRTVAAVAPAGAISAKVQVEEYSGAFEFVDIDIVGLAPTAQGVGYADGDSPGWTWSSTPGNSISANADKSFPLLTLCEAIAGRLTQIEDVIRDDSITDDPGWSIVMDVDRAPSEWLGWLAQFAGVRLPSGLSDADQRIRIKNTDGFKRGTPTAIVAAVQPFLTGTKTVYLVERHGSAYRLTVATKAAETPSIAAVTAAVLTQKPAGIVLAVTTVLGNDYTTLRDTHTSYTDVKNTFTDYAEVLSNPSKQ